MSVSASSSGGHGTPEHAAAAAASGSSSRRSSSGSFTDLGVAAAAASVFPGPQAAGAGGGSRRSSFGSDGSDALGARGGVGLAGAPARGIAISGAPAAGAIFTDAKFAILEIGGHSGVTLDNAIDKGATESSKKLTTDGIQTVVEFAARAKGIDMTNIQGFRLKLGSNVLELYIDDDANPGALKTIKINCNQLKNRLGSDGFKQALSGLHDKSRRIKGYEGVQVDFVKEVSRRGTHAENVGLSTSGNEVRVITDLKLKQITSQDSVVIQKCLQRAVPGRNPPRIRFDQILSSVSNKRKAIKALIEQHIKMKSDEKDLPNKTAEEKNRLSKEIESLQKLYMAAGSNLPKNESHFIDLKAAIALYARLYKGSNLSMVEKSNLVRELSGAFLNTKVSSLWSSFYNKLTVGNTLGIYHPGYVYDPALSTEEKDRFKSESATQVAFETVSLLFDSEEDIPLGGNPAPPDSAQFVHEQYSELAHEFKVTTTSEDASDLLYKIEAARYLSRTDAEVSCAVGDVFDTLLRDIKVTDLIGSRGEFVNLFKSA